MRSRVGPECTRHDGDARRRAYAVEAMRSLTLAIIVNPTQMRLAAYLRCRHVIYAAGYACGFSSAQLDERGWQRARKVRAKSL
jgi:hypothetical protein